MKPVSISPAWNSGSCRIRWCSGIDVWIPSTTNVSNARSERSIASFRSFPEQISFATSES